MRESSSIALRLSQDFSEALWENCRRRVRSSAHWKDAAGRCARAQAAGGRLAGRFQDQLQADVGRARAAGRRPDARHCARRELARVDQRRPRHAGARGVLLPRGDPDDLLGAAQAHVPRPRRAPAPRGCALLPAAGRRRGAAHAPRRLARDRGDGQEAPHGEPQLLLPVRAAGGRGSRLPGGAATRRGGRRAGGGAIGAARTDGHHAAVCQRRHRARRARRRGARGRLAQLAQRQRHHRLPRRAGRVAEEPSGGGVSLRD